MDDSRKSDSVGEFCLENIINYFKSIFKTSALLTIILLVLLLQKQLMTNEYSIMHSISFIAMVTFLFGILHLLDAEIYKNIILGIGLGLGLLLTNTKIGNLTPAVPGAPL
tara:strand:+ start:13078 stop:13407 length:330 start_codon:yes stop_codon:yes gene_type:complete